MPVGHPDVLFGEGSVHVFCPFLHWVICFLGVEFGEFLVDFGYLGSLHFTEKRHWETMQPQPENGWVIASQ